MPIWTLRYGGRRIPLRGTETVIGRGADTHLPVDDALVSRRHAAFRVRDGGLHVEDLRSRNGTMVNGAAISAERALSIGDRVVIGDQTFVVERSDVDFDRIPTGDWSPGTERGAAPRREVATATDTGIDRPDPLLIGVATDARREDDPDRAASAASLLARRLVRAGARGESTDPQTVAGATELLLWLATRLERWVWVDSLFEVNAAQRTVLEPAIIDALHALAEKVTPSGSGAYSAYVAILRRRKSELSLDEKARLVRIEGLSSAVGRGRA